MTTFASTGEVTHIYASGANDRTITVDLVDEDGTHADVARNSQGGLLTIRLDGEARGQEIKVFRKFDPRVDLAF